MSSHLHPAEWRRRFEKLVEIWTALQIDESKSEQFGMHPLAIERSFWICDYFDLHHGHRPDDPGDAALVFVAAYFGLREDPDWLIRVKKYFGSRW